MNEFVINNNTRVIAKRDDGALLVTNHPFATINDIYEEAIIIDQSNNILSPASFIGSLTKFDNWNSTNYYLKASNIVVDSLIGFAVGDALGVPVEFFERNDVRNLNIKDMISGTHNVPKGAWSDDTSMVIATMDSIISNKGKIIHENIMDNFIKMIENGNYTSTGSAFDVGATITKSLNNYKINGDISSSGCLEFNNNGNGSLMRILPISLFCIINNLEDEETKTLINNSSSLTHAHDISKMACYIYTEFLRNLVDTKNPIKAFEYILTKDYTCYDKVSIDAYKRLLDESFIDISDKDIKSTGYVVDTLECVIYCVLNKTNYEEGVLTAINLGGDTDTIGALTGSIFGILYGVNGIPSRWKNKLLKKDYLIKVANEYNLCLNINRKVKING